MEAGRHIWNLALNSGNGVGTKYSATWLGYVAYERLHGSNEKARAVFQRCYARSMEGNGQVEICEAWLRFEREIGSADDYFNACLHAEPVLAKDVAAAEAQAAAAVGAGGHVFAEAPQGGKPSGRGEKKKDEKPQQQQQMSKEEAKALRQQKDPNYQNKRRKEQEDNEGRKEDGQPAAKKAKVAAPVPAAAAADVSGGEGIPNNVEQIVDEQEGAAGGTPMEKIQEEHSKPGSNPTPPTAAASFENQPSIAERRSMTAFVKHLPEEATEESLRELFSPCGSIKLIKLGIDRETGRHKGFAYIEFDAPESVDAACKLHGTGIGDKTLFVARSNPPAADGGGPGRGRGGRGDRGRGRGGGERGGRRGRGEGRGRDSGGPRRGGIGFSGRGGGFSAPRGAHNDRPRTGAEGGGGGGFGGGGGGPNEGGSSAAAPKPKVGLGGFVPRAMKVQKPAGEGGEGPKTNADFRKMLQGDK